MKILILKSSIFLALFIFVFFSIKFLIDLKRNDFFENLIDKFKAKEEERDIQEKANILLQGENEDKKMITKIDYLLNRSRIKTIIPFLTTELFIALMYLIFFVVLGIVLVITKNFIFGLLGSVLVISSIFIVLNVLAKRIFNKIEKEQIGYINVLKNLSVSDNNIISIFEKSLTFVKEPLQSYIEQFVIESKNGIPLHTAFRNLENKIENKKLKDLFKNLDIASRHASNYQAVLDESRIIFKGYTAQKYANKLAARKGRFDICLITFVGVITLMALSIFLNQNIFVQLTLTTMGNIIIAYFIAMFIYTIINFISLDKLNN